MDTQGWIVQLSHATYPLERKPRQPHYRASKHFRLSSEALKKQRICDRNRHSNSFPKGRIRHLQRQINRLDYYVALEQED